MDVRPLRVHLGHGFLPQFLRPASPNIGTSARQGSGASRRHLTFTRQSVRVMDVLDVRIQLRVLQLDFRCALLQDVILELLFVVVHASVLPALGVRSIFILLYTKETRYAPLDFSVIGKKFTL